MEVDTRETVTRIINQLQILTLAPNERVALGAIDNIEEFLEQLRKRYRLKIVTH